MNKKRYIHQITLTAIFIALALIAKQFFTVTLNIYGGAGFRIGLAGVFSSLPALFFGPLFGGITSGIVDLLGYVLKPQGAYIPLLTLTAILSGVLKGFIWKGVKNINVNKFRNVFLTLVIVFLIFGTVNHAILAFFNESGWAEFFNSLGNVRNYIIFGIDLIGIAGLLFFIANKFVLKYTKNESTINNFLKLTITLGISGLIVTTLNTFILRLYIPALSNTTFVLLWIPRVIEEVFIVMIQAYIITIFLSLYKKAIEPRLKV